jgi:hypothetical protein
MVENPDQAKSQIRQLAKIGVYPAGLDPTVASTKNNSTFDLILFWQAFN